MAAEEVEKLKTKGNEFMKAEKYDDALEMYSEAIEKDPSNYVLYSNRSAAYSKKEDFESALKDAEKTIELNSDWPKGYSRKGAALFQLQRLDDAESAYKDGLMKSPDNATLKSSLAEVKAVRASMGNPFCDPLAETKLRNHPKTKNFMDDEVFRLKLRLLRQSPNNLMNMINDPQIMEAMGVLLGVDLTTMSKDGDPMVHKEGRGPSSANLTGEGEDIKWEPMETEQPSETEAPVESKQREQEALAEKEKGNEAYKKKDFTTALSHYDRAYEIDPSNITCLTNKAAVFFEMQKWEECIKQCEEAVEKGRELRADFKVIAKALGRIGSVHMKQEEYALAVKFFDKSLTEFRNQDIIKKKKEAESKFKEIEKKAYIDPEKSLEEKEKGNKLFKEGKYPEAIKCYNEAIKRNPEDPILFSNRAACYQKLLEFPLALKDCDACISLDPKFVKGYIRKGHALVGVKDLVKARQAFQAALDIDPNNAEARDGVRKCMGNDDPEARRKAAMHDPEVQAILNDPAMQMILQQMQSQPEALRDHLKNPEIAAKIQKLLECGFISLR